MKPSTPSKPSRKENGSLFPHCFMIETNERDHTRYQKQSLHLVSYSFSYRAISYETVHKSVCSRQPAQDPPRTHTIRYLKARVVVLHRRRQGPAGNPQLSYQRQRRSGVSNGSISFQCLVVGEPRHHPLPLYFIPPRPAGSCSCPCRCFSCFIENRNGLVGPTVFDHAAHFAHEYFRLGKHRGGLVGIQRPSSTISAVGFPISIYVVDAAAAATPAVLSLSAAVAVMF